MNRTLTLILLVSCIVPAVAPVVAQEETTPTTTPTPTATASEDNTTATATPTPTPTATATSTPTTTPTATPAGSETPAPAGSDSGDSSTNNESVALVLSETLRITEWSYRGGTFIIHFESDRYQAVSLTAIPESTGSGENSGSANYRERFVEPNRETVVRIDAPKSGGRARVWIVSDATSETGTIHYLEAGRSSSLLAGPYDGSDVRDAGIGASLGTAFAVLYAAARAKLGAAEGGERIA